MGEMAAKLSNGVKTQAMQIPMHSLLGRRGKFGGTRWKEVEEGQVWGTLGVGGKHRGRQFGGYLLEAVRGLWFSGIGGSGIVSAWFIEAEEGAF